MKPAFEADAGFGIYIHWPFCAQKCPYCDFNSHVRHGGWDEARFLAAYKRELDHVAALTDAAPAIAGTTTEAARGAVSSVFFGGGTPSLMQPATVAAILDHVARLWPIDADAEITLEANPGSVEAQRFAGYKAAGVNRVSLGIQSLRDEDLRKLGRIHTAAEARAALDIARSTFERHSFDLIYARPGQSPANWRAELEAALSMAGRHISLYQLTIEPETPFAALHAAGKLVVPDGDLALALYEITQELTEAAGLPAYEISNHARPGEECQHNLLYWRYGRYAGIGPGAHGRLLLGATRHATVTERNPEAWLGLVEQCGHGFTQIAGLTRAEEADEMLLMGLRLREGLDLDRFRSLAGTEPSEPVIAELVQLGLLACDSAATSPRPLRPGAADDGFDMIRSCIGPGLVPSQAHVGRRLRATRRGRLVLNALVYRLAASCARTGMAAAPRLPAVDNPSAAH